MSSIIERLTEGVVNRDMRAEGHALLTKWEKTGLLEGLKDGRSRQSMARLLENQAKELLRESSTMAGGDVEGFAAVAFPIVRRVFAGLIANDLVSVQPMSLPAGLIFFLDFTISRDTGDGVDDMYSRLGYKWSGSFYGGNVVGSQITGGVDLDYAGVGLAGGPYNLNSGYSSPTGSGGADGLTLTPQAGPYGTFGTQESSGSVLNKAAGWDPDFVSGSTCVAVVTVLKSGLDQVNIDGPQAFNVSCSLGNGILKTGATTGTAAAAVATARLIRRHTEIVSGSGTPRLKLVFVSTGSDGAAPNLPKELSDLVLGALTASWNTVSWAQTDDLTSGGALGSIVGQTEWGLENQQNIPEIDIKVESIAVTAQTRKLRARWSPELAQDLNAYHSLDAEVELTQILSEQVALEIDREILNDLLSQANGANLYWSRAPGKFLNKETGAEIARTSTLTPGPAFTGTVREWYETLVETIIDCANTIHRKTLRGSANFVVLSPDVATLLEASVYYRPSYSIDGDGQVSAPFNLGAEKVGTLSNRFTVYKDPYFPRSKILVGYKGGSYLETGYIYAPYVPLIVTPTIFAPEDFTPRKGVMTRYGKKMVRSDFYGTVTVADLDII